MAKRNQTNKGQGLKELQYLDPKEELYLITNPQRGQDGLLEEGSMSNSMKMLTAIPEVDLGME